MTQHRKNMILECFQQLASKLKEATQLYKLYFKVLYQSDDEMTNTTKKRISAKLSEW
jgi:nitrate reductase assembly molybdenum cofactor insertion protein NarJ